jgi:hypothetical protein
MDNQNKRPEEPQVLQTPNSINGLQQTPNIINSAPSQNTDLTPQVNPIQSQQPKQKGKNRVSNVIAGVIMIIAFGVLTIWKGSVTQHSSANPNSSCSGSNCTSRTDYHLFNVVVGKSTVYVGIALIVLIIIVLIKMIVLSLKKKRSQS